MGEFLENITEELGDTMGDTQEDMTLWETHGRIGQKHLGTQWDIPDRKKTETLGDTMRDTQ